MRFFKMDNSTKRLFEVVIDDLDEVLSQAVDKHEREEAFSNDRLDEILSQSFDMFEEVKNSVEDAIDITDMFEFGGPSLVMARRFATKKGEEIYIMMKIMMSEAGVEGYYTNHSLRATAVSRLFQNDVGDKLIKGVTGHRSDALQGYKRETEEQLLKVSKIVQGQKEKESTVKGNSNSALTSALEIPSSSGTLVLNVCGGNCNITINNN